MRSPRFGDATRALAAIALAIVLFLALNIVVALTLRSVRADLTADRIYTIAPATRAVLNGVHEPVTLRLYESRALMAAVPDLRAYADRVEELLQSYRELSGGRVRFERVDPQPFSPDEDRAIGYRLHAVPLNQAGDQGYFGLVGTNSLDGLERIEFLDPRREALLEYDLTTLIGRLSRPDRPRVGILDGLRMFGSVEQGRNPLAVLDAIARNYHVAPIDPAKPSFDGIDILLVAHPHDLPPPLLWAIDQYVLAGHPAALFIDPLAENSPPDPRSPALPAVPTSDLGPLLAAWGVDMRPDGVVGDSTLAMRVTAAAGGQRVVASYLPWLRIGPDNLNHDDVITGELQLMRLSSAGALRSRAGATTTLRPLIQSSPQSMLFPTADIKVRPNPNTLLSAFRPGGAPMILAARVTGAASTAFPAGPPDGAPTAGALKTGTINLVVTADTDLLDDSHVVGPSGQPTSNNADFVLNMLDSLAGGVAVGDLRSRGLSIRTFTTIDRMQAASEANFQRAEQALNGQLQTAQQDLESVQNEAQGAPGLSRDQEARVVAANHRIVDLRRQLRDVRAAGRADLDRLRQTIEVLTIGLVPGLLVLMALAFWGWRRLRLGRYLQALRSGAAA